MKKKGLLFILIPLIVIAGIFVFLQLSTRPLPDEQRNLSTTDITMQVRIDDPTNRTPIVRTYKKEEFDALNDSERARLKDTVNGNVEGDVPAVHLENSTGLMEFAFVRTERPAGDQTPVPLVSENRPELKIAVQETLYSEAELLAIRDFLTETEDGSYRYEIQRYLTPGMIPAEENTEFHTESMYIEVHYQVDGELYVSVFAVNTVEK